MEGSQFLGISSDQGQRLGDRDAVLDLGIGGDLAGDHSARSGIINNESYYLSTSLCVADPALRAFIGTTDI